MRNRKPGHRPHAPPQAPQVAAAPDGRSSTQTLLILLVVAAVLVTAVHWPALSARALSFDDQDYLVDNQLVRNPGFTSAWRFLSEVLEPSTIGGYYQPMAMISLMVDYGLGGRIDYLSPFHTTSLILHVANTLLIITLLYLLFGQPWPAAIVGILFGIHPLTVEPIPWVGERKTLLAAFFSLLALIGYVRYAKTHRLRWFLAATLGYLLALLSKPTSTPLPLAMLVLDGWPLQRFSRRAIVEKLPLLALAAVSALITFTSQQRTAVVALPGQYNPIEIPMMICHNIMFYLYKLVWPANLTSHYPLPAPFRLTEPWILAGMIGTCVLIPLLIWSLRRTRSLVAGWLIYFLMLLPTIQIIGFSNVIASDKYAYLPAIGLLLVIAYALAQWSSRATNPTDRTRRIGILAGAAALIFCAEAYGTRQYLSVWRDTETLYRHMIALAPQAGTLHAHLGNVYLEQGRTDEAVAEMRDAARLTPNFAPIHNDLANALKTQGKFDEAIAEYAEALRLQPNYAAPYSNLGALLVSRGRAKEALVYFQEAIRRLPKLADAHYNLATALVSLGRTNEAVASFRKALEYRYHYPDAHNNLAVVLAGQGRVDEAIDHFREAIRFSPDYAEAHFNLAETLARAGRNLEAIQEYQEVLRIDSSDEDARRAIDQLNRKGT